MMVRSALLALAASLTFATATHASIPGNIEQRARAGLKHVCVDGEFGDDGYIACVAQEGGDPSGVYTGSECVAAGLAAACVIDLIPRPILQGRLFLFADDDAEDNFGGFQISAGFVLELKIKGKWRALVELFDGTRIGNWNEFDEFFVTNVSGGIEFSNGAGVFQFANLNLTDLGLEIRDLATGAWPKLDLTDAVPILLAVTRDGEPAPNDSSFGDLLASGASFELTLGFARVKP